jgi:hypothetical protein
VCSRGWLCLQQLQGLLLPQGLMRQLQQQRHQQVSEPQAALGRRLVLLLLAVSAASAVWLGLRVTFRVRLGQVLLQVQPHSQRQVKGLYGGLLVV